ncbi:HEAT repeat domain-containing protein [Streptomyces sp. NPDC002004]
MAAYRAIAADRDSSGRIRAEAVQVLQRRGGPEVLDCLLTLAHDSWSGYVQSRAIVALARMGHVAVADAVPAFLDDRSVATPYKLEVLDALSALPRGASRALLSRISSNRRLPDYLRKHCLRLLQGSP